MNFHQFSPRMWRWSCTARLRGGWFGVFSTYVEVILINLLKRTTPDSFLHVCGGDPVVPTPLPKNKSFSPRMWRWSYDAGTSKVDARVFSTYVEVIPISESGVTEAQGFLHVCGGDPKNWYEALLKLLFSPRMWRWSKDDHTYSYSDQVFSTYVEVILCTISAFKMLHSFLHVCGGDPNRWWSS